MGFDSISVYKIPEKCMTINMNHIKEKHDKA